MNWDLLHHTQEQTNGPFPQRIWSFCLDGSYLLTWDSTVSGPISEAVTESAWQQPKLFLYHNVKAPMLLWWSSVRNENKDSMSACAAWHLSQQAYSWSIYLDAQDDSCVLNISKYGLCCQSSVAKCFSDMGTVWDLKCSGVTWAQKSPVCVFSFLIKLLESNAILKIILSKILPKLVQVAVWLDFIKGVKTPRISHSTFFTAFFSKVQSQSCTK